MKVTVRIDRDDLLRLNLYLAPRQRANWIYFGVLWALIFFALMYFFKWSFSVKNVTTGLFSAFAGAAIGTILGLLFQLIQILMMSRNRNGILGEHQYEIRDEGLFERTQANEGLAKWSGIEAMQKSNRFILVQITGFLFHIIPRSAFNTEQEFDRFYDELQTRWKSAV